ncbi:MAG: CPBP family intramembrane glutamic endopeptidase [Candidatus Hodarchaeales archaeon]|jgi:membrane protease YdiL (CAAX protease family)
MRKFEIVEIENSFLNFFTPAVLIPVSFFLFNLIGWLYLFLNYLISEQSIGFEFELVQVVTQILFLAIVCLLLYYLLIYLPRLKVNDAEFKQVNKQSFYIIATLFCLFILSQSIIISLYELVFDKIDFHFDYVISDLNTVKSNPFFLVTYFIYSIILISLFSELVYRRAIIPMLEDRGLSPFHAVILASFAGGLINIPGYILYPDTPHIIYNSIITVLLGFFAGLAYVRTRNIIFPIILHSFLIFYYDIVYFLSETHLDVYELFNSLILLFALVFILYFVFKITIFKRDSKWIKFFKKHSTPNILKGVIGYFVISIGLLTIHGIVAKIGRILFVTTQGEPFPGYFIYIMIFYAIAFSIPFFLSISTEWAKHPSN